MAAKTMHVTGIGTTTSDAITKLLLDLVGELARMQLYTNDVMAETTTLVARTLVTGRPEVHELAFFAKLEPETPQRAIYNIATSRAWNMRRDANVVSYAKWSAALEYFFGPEFVRTTISLLDIMVVQWEQLLHI